MKIISDALLENHQPGFDLAAALQRLDETFVRSDSFNFYTSIAVITSSKIEGEPMEIDSYLKHKIQHIEYRPELTEKPNDLFGPTFTPKKTALKKTCFHRRTGS
jgi:hypothetical protein